MNNIVMVAMVVLLFSGCGDKKASLHGNDKVTVSDFISAFPKLTLPFTASDTTLQKSIDTTTISNDVFNQFVPDSLLEKIIGKNNESFTIKPIGKIDRPDGEYLVAVVNDKKKSTMIVFLFDKKYHFVAALELLNNSKSNGYLHSVNINNEPTFTVSREKSTADNQLLYTRNGYAFNKTANAFLVVVNDSNEDTAKNNEVTNPIDTFPAINKFSGDYILDKKNFISVRDGKNASVYNFFIHFEKNEGDCIGKLKG